MVDVKTFPTTEEELLELGPGPHRFPASFADFENATAHSKLKMEYVNESIVIMSYATLVHEAMVLRLGALLSVLDARLFSLIGSNHKVYRKGMDNAFAPDIFVIKGRAKRVKPTGKTSMVTNPWLIIEILSPGTEPYDLGTKLPAYKRFPSVEYIFYVDQYEERATLHSRSSAKLWRSEDFGPEQPNITIGDARFSLTDIYQNLLGEEE